MARLTKKMELFIHEYLIDMNASRAAIAAGYSEKTAGEMGYENLNKPQIKARIEEVMAKRVEKLELTADHFATRLEKIASAAERSALVEDEEGVNILASKEAADVARGCSMDTAKLLGLVVERRETTIVTHEERLAALREKLNEQRRPTTH